MREIWKKTFCSDNYAVSNLGRVKSLNKKTILNSFSNSQKYKKVDLYIKGEKKILVHDLVYRTFYPDTPEDFQIHHINLDRTDNRLENLIGLSVEDHYKLHKELKNKYNGKLSKPVLQYDLDGNFIKEYLSIAEAQRHGYNSICRCCKGITKTANGYIWKYKNT